jgi:hypothetical protein
MASPVSRRMIDTAGTPGGRWTPHRLWAILRREGMLGVRSRALALLGWRSYILYVRSLEAAAGVVAAVPVEIDELRAEHVGDYLAFRPGPAAGFLDRLRAGHACFAARHDGRIVAATWVARGGTRVEPLDRDFLPASDEIYLFDSFAAAEHRGQRLFPAVFEVIAARYRARGYRRAVTLIAPYNHASSRSRERSGFRRVGTVRSWSRGPIRTSDFVPERFAAQADAGRPSPP